MSLCIWCIWWVWMCLCLQRTERSRLLRVCCTASRSPICASRWRWPASLRFTAHRSPAQVTSAHDWQVFWGFKADITFIQQGCISIIKSYSKDFYSVTKCCSCELCSLKGPDIFFQFPQKYEAAQLLSTLIIIRNVFEQQISILYWSPKDRVTLKTEVMMLNILNCYRFSQYNYFTVFVDK